MFYAVIGVLAIIIDQWTKYAAAQNLVFGDAAKTFIPGILNLVNVHNTGAAFSFLSNNPNAGKLFAVFALVFTALVVVGIATNFISGRFAQLCAVLVAAGGVSNAIDRLIYNYVQDMMQFAFWESFPVFNVADIFITVFCLLFIVCILFGDKSPRTADLEDNEAESSGVARGSRQGRKADKEFAAPAPRRSVKISRSFNKEAAQSRKSRQNQYADEFEQFKARKEEARRSAPQNASSSASVPKFDSSDPFVEWEKANARINAQKASEADAAVRSVLSDEESRAVSPSRAVTAEATHDASATTIYQPVSSPSVEPAADETVIYQAVPKKPAEPAPKAEPSEEFSLDDILAEFK